MISRRSRKTVQCRAARRAVPCWQCISDWGRDFGCYQFWHHAVSAVLLTEGWTVSPAPDSGLITLFCFAKPAPVSQIRRRDAGNRQRAMAVVAFGSRGILGGIAFAIVDIDGSVLWGALMAFLSLVPAVGSASRLGTCSNIPVPPPTSYGKGCLSLASFVIIVGLVDNILRPLLVR